METKTVEQIKEALVKASWRTNTGKGPRVCYPNEVLHELFGKETAEKYYIDD